MAAANRSSLVAGDSFVVAEKRYPDRNDGTPRVSAERSPESAVVRLDRGPLSAAAPIGSPLGCRSQADWRIGLQPGFRKCSSGGPLLVEPTALPMQPHQLVADELGLLLTIVVIALRARPPATWKRRNRRNNAALYGRFVCAVCYDCYGPAMPMFGSPLIAVAEAVGGDWPELARAGCCYACDGIP
jgi:hypothetical protein